MEAMIFTEAKTLAGQGLLLSIAELS